jgi:hypothetical protein
MHQDTLQVQHCTNQLLREEQERNTQELREGPKGGSVTSCKYPEADQSFSSKNDQAGRCGSITTFERTTESEREVTERRMGFLHHTW